MTQEIRQGQTAPTNTERTDLSGPVALVIGDGKEDCLLPDEVFEDAGFRIVRADGFPEADESCTMASPDLVFMPLTLDGKLMNGQLLNCLDRDPAPVIVVVASNDQINSAAEAMRLGAYDCLFKPFSRGRLVRTVEAAVKQLKHAPPPPRPATRPSRPMAARPRPETPPPEPPVIDTPVPQRGVHTLNLGQRGFVASSARMQAVLEKASIVARSEAPVFISGEVGTGKSTFAALVHEVSSRAERPLVTLACATLTAQDFEARVHGPQGALARAAGGTLYLDEVADLPAEVQPKVTRIIESAEAGGAPPRVRIIASTGHDPRTALVDGRIRPELFYRLHVAPLELPPLRKRDGDPALIARVRLAAFSEAEGRGFTGFTDTALEMISRYDWPGNLRELINTMHTIVLMNPGPLVTPKLLPAQIRAGLDPDEAMPAAPHTPPLAARPSPRTGGGGALSLVGKTLAEIERAVIEATIRAEDGSVPRAARVLDVSPSTLYRKREAWAKTGGD